MTLSIDLEDWYHAELMAGRRASFLSRAEATQPVLDLLDRYQTKASSLLWGRWQNESRSHPFRF